MPHNPRKSSIVRFCFAYVSVLQVKRAFGAPDARTAQLPAQPTSQKKQLIARYRDSIFQENSPIQTSKSGKYFPEGKTKVKSGFAKNGFS